MDREYNDIYEPPLGPPPLLNAQQIEHIAYQGWLPIDISSELIQQLEALSSAAAAFFDRSHGEKRELYRPSRGTECGFYHVAGEKEYVTLRHAVHPDSDLERYANEVWQQAGMLLYRILCDLNRAAGNDVQAWDHLVEGSLGLPKDGSNLDDTLTLMRIFRYYPTKGVAEKHVDIGLLTLCIGNGKGLQVLDYSGEQPQWIDAEGPVVLVADMARALMRNQIRAGLHRVVGNPAGRTSTVFALRPCLKQPTDLSAFGGHGVIDTKEYFYKIKGAKYNINATKDIREKQRQKQQEQRKAGNAAREATFGHG